jgi:hypothetical protein
MAGAVDPAATTTFTKQIDRIMAEIELINRRLDCHKTRLMSIEATLGLLPLAPAKMQSSSNRPVPQLVLWSVEVVASLVVEPLPLESPTPQPLPPPPPIRIGTQPLHLAAGSGCLLHAPRPAPLLPRLDLIYLKEHESALPVVTALHGELPSSPQ